MYPITVTKLALHAAMRCETSYAYSLWNATHPAHQLPRAPFTSRNLDYHLSMLRAVSLITADLWPQAQCVMERPEAYPVLQEMR